ncbi:ATP-binding protein [Pedobacter ginsengiterrae]|uniref:histidine kinase n=1 Tax=Pedobacter ginsengiterrae TaxID=871696 RepID=A0ABP7NYG0_9SPHI
MSRDYNLIVTASGAYLVLEIEPAIPGQQGLVQKNIGSSLSKMLVDKNLDHLIANTAEQVRSVINFDRVMIYRFSADGHGEVIAESKTNNLDSWIGQHFPASDIPLQARELYKKNLTRLISNVSDSPSGIMGLPGLENLDLTFSQLRAVSPVHIQYLKNMGVASSFSISLIYKSELWGLIACHHYSPKFIEFTARDSAKLMGQILSSALEFRQDELNHLVHENFNANLDQLAKYMLSEASMSEALTARECNLLSIVDAQGAVLCFESKLSTLGTVPTKDTLTALCSWISDHVEDHMFYTDHLASVFPEGSSFADMPCGVMMVNISKELGDFVLFFKPEQRSTVSWAGKPDEEIKRKSDPLLNISPRSSFELWAEIISGKSLPWSFEEIHSVSRLRSEISYALNLKATGVRVLNERLTSAYEELDAFSYGISHDLKNPIATIKVLAQLLLRDKSLTDRSRQISVSIESSAEKMNRMVEEVLEYSRVGRLEPKFDIVDTQALVREICSELKLIYHLYSPIIEAGNLHNIYADPRLIVRVFSNVLTNAAKYSQKHQTPKIHIESTLEDNLVKFRIRDNGIGIKPADLPRVFDLFSRMSNVGTIEGSGVGLAIVKKIVDRHKGSIWAENLQEGTCFNLILMAPPI